MTPRRYLASTLTVDNRSPEHAEDLTSERDALRRAWRETKAELAASQQECADLRRQNEELAEMVRVRDEIITEFKDRNHADGEKIDLPNM